MCQSVHSLSGTGSKGSGGSAGDPGKKSGGGISPGLECSERVCPRGSDFLPGLWERGGCPRLTTELPHLGLLPFLSDFRVQKWLSEKEQTPHLPGK